VIPAAATGGALATTAELLQVTGLVQTLQTAPGLEFFMDERDATPATEWEAASMSFTR
jgi:hypothetical protein